jgi:hypothetical protein
VGEFPQGPQLAGFDAVCDGRNQWTPSRISSARTVACDQVRAPCAVGTASVFKSRAIAYAVLPSVRSRIMRATTSAQRGPPRRLVSILVCQA